MTSTTAPTRRAMLALATAALAMLAGGVGSTATATAAASSTIPARTAVTGGATSTVAATPRAALLTASQMPKVNEVQAWKRVTTRRTWVSTAQPVALSSLGFTTKARRDFTRPGASATNVVLTFDTPAEATAAYRTVKGWRATVGDRVPAAGKLRFRGPQTPVAVASGKGSFFSFTFVDKVGDFEGTFEWLGVTRRGASLSVVAWRVGGADANYESDPTIATVQAANVTLAKAF